MGTEDAALSWGCCALGMEDRQFVKCISCNTAYHHACLSATANHDNGTELVLFSNWTCPLCTGRNGKTDNTDNAPIRFNNCSDSQASSSSRASKRQATQSPPGPSSQTLTVDKVRDVVQDIMKKEMGELLAQIQCSLMTELKTMKKDVQEVKESIDFMSRQYDDFVQDHRAQEETIRDLQSQNMSLQETVHSLNSRLNQIEQHALRSNIEIQCVPEKKTENLIEIITDLAQVISSDITKDNIIHCTRIAKLNAESTRPRSIIVQLNSPNARDNFIAASTTYNKLNPLNKLNSSLLGLGGDKVPIYVAEHLSAANKALHAAARLKKKELGYKFIWVRDGRIFLRKTESSEFILVRNKEMLNRLT